MTGCAGLLLAAGGGRRLGQPKATVELAGERLVDRGVRLLRDGGCASVVVVVGAVDVAVDGARVVRNPDWRSGLGSSLRVGLAALTGTADAAVVALADQPFVSPVAVSRLVAAWRAGAEAAVATYAGRPRNPALLSAGVWVEVAAGASGEQGAREWLRSQPDRVVAVPCDDAGAPYDVDTPEDLQQALARVKG